MKRMVICLFALALVASMSSVVMAGDPVFAAKNNLGLEADATFEGHVLTATPDGRDGAWLYAPAEADDPALRAAIAACTGGTVDYFDARYDTPTLAFLCDNYDVVFTWVNYSYLDPTGMGDVLAEFVDCGGCVILGQWCCYTAQVNWLEGAIMHDAAYRVVTYGAGYVDYSGYCWTGDCDDECIYTGVSSLCPLYRDVLVPDPVNGHPCGTYTDGGYAYIGHGGAYSGKIHYVPGATGFAYAGPDFDQFLCNMCNCPGATAAESSTWGSVKSLYR